MVVRLTLLLALGALGCGARTAADVPASGRPATDAAVDAARPDGGVDASRPRRDGGVFVPAPPTRLAAGTHHTCAVVGGGQVRCWGSNRDGQLGVPPDDREPTPGDPADPDWPPTEVPGIDDAVEVTAGSARSCARHASGEVSCWGRLGGPAAPWIGPTRVAGLVGAVELTSGNYHSCARLSDASVVCWGANTRGQLGDGTTTDRETPTPVVGLSRVDEITAGWDHSCARVGGAIYCWGSNDDGQLGDGTFDAHVVPDAVATTIDAVEIAAGWSHTCARTTEGDLYCWGRRWGEAPSSTSEELHRLFPDLVPDVVDIVEVDAGGAHTCARDADGRVACWGRNRNGQLGTHPASAAGDRTTPAPVEGLGRVDELVNGWVHTCARERSGRVLCWGGSDLWSRGSRGPDPTPRVVEGL